MREFAVETPVRPAPSGNGLTPLPKHRPEHHRDGAPQPATALWRVEDLSVRYGTKTALEAVTMDIRKGGVTAVIGPSGCGKSSFLNCLNRMDAVIPECCTSGSIRFADRELLTEAGDGTELRRRVGLIFQRPTPFPMPIRRNLELPLRERGLRDRHEIAGRIEAALMAVGLWSEVRDRLGESALKLSGGQQQRLCLARALILEPEAILMDEPCSALDPLATAAIEDLIRSLRERLTVVIVTHNLGQAKRLGDDVALFWCRDGAGRLIECGTTEQVFEAPREKLTQLYVSGGIG